MVPLVCMVIFCKAFDAKGQPQTGSPERPPEMTLANLYLLVYLASMELSFLSYSSTGCIIRVSEFENKISHFLFVSRGSRLAYMLANFAYDFVEIVLIVAVTLLGSKLIVFGSPAISLQDCTVGLILVSHTFSKLLITGYPVSYLFNTKKHLLSYYSLFNMALVLLLFGATIYAFARSDYDSLLLDLLNYASVTKLAANCVASTIPDSLSGLVVFRDSVVGKYGGLTTNLLLILCHVVVYFVVNLVLERLKYSVSMKRRARDGRNSQVEGIVNRQELQDERDYTVNTLPQISVIDVDKTYGNGFTAAKDVTFGVEQNKIFTLLGPNGAGKSSLLDVLCGISERSHGEVIYEGKSIEKYRMASACFCLQKNYLWEYLTFEEHVRLVASWRGIDKQTTSALLKDIDKGLDIGKNMRIKALHLSGGNQRKLNTILALLSAPRIYILDEPTAGMDPKSRR